MENNLMESIKKAQQKVLEIMTKDLQEKAASEKALTCIHPYFDYWRQLDGNLLQVCNVCGKKWEYTLLKNSK